MIKYEIFAGVNAKMFHAFESNYQYNENHRIFVEKEGVLYVCNIRNVTGDLTKEIPVTRLNCHVSKYVRE